MANNATGLAWLERLSGSGLTTWCWCDIMLVCRCAKKTHYRSIKLRQKNKCRSRAGCYQQRHPTGCNPTQIGSPLMNITLNDALTTKLERNTYAAKYTDYGAFEALNKAKALVMAISPSHKKTVRYALTVEVADYYEIPYKTVKNQIDLHRDEFVSDGLRVVRKAEALGLGLNARPTSPSVAIWTPRAMLRLGMLLKKSEVAKQVRSTLLDIAEAKPEQKTLEFNSDRSKCVNQIVEAITQFEAKQTSPINSALRATISKFGLTDAEAMMGEDEQVMTTANLEKVIGLMTEEAGKYFFAELRKTEWVGGYTPETLLDEIKCSEPQLLAVNKRSIPNLSLTDLDRIAALFGLKGWQLLKLIEENEGSTI
jgi:hypothetical protein